MSAMEMVNTDSSIPVFNECTAGHGAIRQMLQCHSIDDTDKVKDEESIGEVVPKLPEAFDIL